MEAPTPETPTEPSEQQMFLTLRQLGVPDDEAYAFIQGTQNMASQNVIAEIRVQNAKMDARDAKMDARDAKMDAVLAAQQRETATALANQQREISALRWMIGLGFTGLALLIALVSLLGGS